MTNLTKKRISLSITLVLLLAISFVCIAFLPNAPVVSAASIVYDGDTYSFEAWDGSEYFSEQVAYLMNPGYIDFYLSSAYDGSLELYFDMPQVNVPFVSILVTIWFDGMAPADSFDNYDDFCEYYGNFDYCEESLDFFSAEYFFPFEYYSSFLDSVNTNVYAAIAYDMGGSFVVFPLGDDGFIGTLIREQSTPTYPLPADPVKTGYTFTGWYIDAACTQKYTETYVTGDITLYAGWRANTYTVNFNANGGTTSTASKTLTYDSTYGILPTPTRTGYTFSGWYTAASGGTNVTSSSQVKITSTQTLYAHWTANTYKVTFDANGGTTSTASKTVTYNSTYGTLPTPTRTGYTFAGWYTAKTGGSKVESTTKVAITSAQTLYARWTANTYTLSFDVKGGTPSFDSITVVYDGTYGTLPVPTRTGYAFSGWYFDLSDDDSQVEDNAVVKITSAQTLYAKWVPYLYKVTFDANGGRLGSNDGEMNVTYDSKYGTLPAAFRDGYTFNGWYTAKTGGTKVTSETIVKTASAHTLYAQWTANSYKVTFDANGGSTSTTEKTVTYDATYGTLPSPTRTGYTFAGWYTAKTSGSKVESTTKVAITSAQTLYARWTANTYTVTFDANGGTTTTASKTVTYDSTYGELPRPTRTGYAFDGWYYDLSDELEVDDSSTVIVASNHTLYARWYAISVKVTFDANGGTASSTEKNVTFDSTYGELPTATRTGYTFNGWYTAQTGGTKLTVDTKVTNAAAHTMYARWTANTYKITFNANGGTTTVTEKNVTYDSTYGELPTPTRTGYTFSGWYTSLTGGSQVTASSKVTITSARTFYARWTANTYKVTLVVNGGTVTSTEINVTYDGTYSSLPTPTRTGYTFNGWYTAQTGGSQVTTSTKVTITSAQTLYARWTANTYKVTLDVNGGTATITEFNVTYDGTYSSLPTPTRTCYTFNGWYTAQTGGSQVTSSTKVAITSAQTLYARWTANPYNVVFNGNGSTSGDVYSQSFTYDKAQALQQNAFQKIGYHFVGWATSATGSKVYNDKQSVTNIAGTNTSVTLYAIWQANTYTVTFNANNGVGTMNSLSMTYDAEAVNLPTNTITREGYTFKGWSTSLDGKVLLHDGLSVRNMTAENGGTITLYAIWEIIQCKVTFIVDGEIYSIVIVDWGSTFESVFEDNINEAFYEVEEGQELPNSSCPTLRSPFVGRRSDKLLRMSPNMNILTLPFVSSFGCSLYSL